MVIEAEPLHCSLLATALSSTTPSCHPERSRGIAVPRDFLEMFSDLQSVLDAR